MISKKYNELVKKLEDNIEDKRDLNCAKNVLADLSIAYVDEINKINNTYASKVCTFEERLAKLESKFKDVEIEEIPLSETICCPYCNFSFLVEYDDANHEITCPKCNNLIELDWGEFEDDM